jgi:two-component system chemotaxis sensor kinase CheA
MSVPRADYDALVLALEDERPYDNVRALASAWATAPVELHLRRLAVQAEQLAERLGKGPITVVVEDDGTRVDERFDELFAVMVHVVRNAVDHGLEPAEERLRQGKAEAGHLRLVARREGDAICLRVEDDGRGIAWDEIVRRARRASGDESGAPFSAEEQKAALFQAGVSTSAQVTEISGRGVGLSAVKETVERLGGVIEVRSAPGSGACFEVRVPWESPAKRGGSVRRTG